MVSVAQSYETLFLVEAVLKNTQRFVDRSQESESRTEVEVLLTCISAHVHDRHVLFEFIDSVPDSFLSVTTIVRVVLEQDGQLCLVYFVITVVG